MDRTTVDRGVGCLLGLACGDALGRPVEFEPSRAIGDAYGRLTEMRGGGTHGQPAGTVTDDTDLAAAAAAALLAEGGFDAGAAAARFVEWYRSDPFDVGALTGEVLSRLADGDDVDAAARAAWERRPEGKNAGNGSVVRCPPYALAYDDQERLAAVAAADAAITHADPWCVEAGVALARLLQELLGGADPEAALDAAIAVASERDAPRELRTALAVALDDGARLETSGYVTHTVETALHDGLGAPDAETAIVTAVNRGGDADTIGAVTGALAGARFGADAIPDRWLDHVDEAERLRGLATDLVEGEFD